MNKPKKKVPEDTLTNANYFGGYDEKVNGKNTHFTLPAGSLIADLKTSEPCINKYLRERGKVENGKAYFDSYDFNYMN